MCKTTIYLVWVLSFLLAMFSALSNASSTSLKQKKPDQELGRGLLTTPLSISEQKISFPRDGCEARDDCDLKEIVFYREDNEFPIDPSIQEDSLARGTWFMAGIETTTVAALKKYAFVQFIRGCMWNSMKKPDGPVSTWFAISRKHLGERTHFVHRDWVVDSEDLEPVSTADGENGDRHYFLQWTDPRLQWIPMQQQKLFGEETPTIPFGFVVDALEPLAMFWPNDSLNGKPDMFSGKAINRSLEFQKCLYRTNDVPKITDGSTRGFGEPIACGSWRSSHVYDYDRGMFTSPPGIAEECKRPFSDEEKSNEEFFRSE